MKDSLSYIEVCNDLPSFHMKDFHKNVNIYENSDNTDVPYVSFYVWDYRYLDFDLEKYVSQKLKK